MLVQKYGGSSLADPQRVRLVAERIVRTLEDHEKLVVVVSAMGATTDALIELAGSTCTMKDLREMDMLLSTGEQVSAAILSMVLNEKGIQARSYNGYQLGIITTSDHCDAKILEIDQQVLGQALEKHRVVVITGYQGISREGDITTLGRGGSDTTAVALANLLGARCELYSDVAGIFTCDPRIEPDAQKLECISYEEMLELSRLGANVVNPVAVEIAMNNDIEVYCASTFSEEKGTLLKGHIQEEETIKSVVGLAVKKYIPEEGGAHYFREGQGVALVSAVGRNLGEDGRVRETIYQVLSREMNEPVYLSASTHSISALMPEDRIRRGVRALAEAFFLL
ncbi:MAG TPA: aspartate kinase [Synergistales bacterium]|nr:aspartate kinase [Synergistales bacterium]